MILAQLFTIERNVWSPIVKVFMFWVFIDLWPLFDALKEIPTLVVRGSLSDLLMMSTVEEMQRRKPDMVFVNVPDVGHAPFLTEEASWKALSDFLT